MRCAKVSEHDFVDVWPALLQTWLVNGHCMRLGCGRETLSRWVEVSTGLRVHPGELRRHLLHASYLRLLRLGRGVGRHGYTTAKPTTLEVMF